MAQADFTRIATNIGALNALQSLRTINNKLGVHQMRLSTGKRINSAADDPAGLTIATKMNARSEGLKVSQNNIGDAMNMLSVAEAGLGQMTDILVTMRSKAEQAASDTLGASERAAIANQLEAYAAQIDDIVAETKWNGALLLDGTANKRFQTGVDEGEVTTWRLSQAHTAEAGLGVSTSYASAGVTNPIYNASVTAATNVGVFNSLTQLNTGSFAVEILDKAADATNGNVNVDGNLLVGVSAVGVTTSADDELTSGENYTITIDAVNASNDIDYTIRDSSGTVVENVTGADFSAAGANDVLSDDVSGASTVGISLTFTTDASGMVAGDVMTFEYIAAGQAKLELNDATNQALQIDTDGSGATTGSSTSVYTDAGTTYDTGRGVQITLGAIAAVGTGDSASFDYHQSGAYVVDVSTAQKAASYMTTVNSSLDVVNSSMADLGSLMARLAIKNDAVSVAQVNTEAAYNRIMNADMAFEQLEATKLQILQQTAVTMLAQANVAPQGILNLFR